MTTNWYKICSGYKNIYKLSAIKIRTPQDVSVFLKSNLKVPGYRQQYTIFYRDNNGNMVPILENQIKQSLLAILQSNQQYWSSICSSAIKAEEQEDRPELMEASVEFEESGLTFTWINSFTISLPDGIEVKTRNNRNQPNRNEDKQLQQIRNTPQETYITHVNQCGYLLANTTLFFGKTERMWASGCRTTIRNITLEMLRTFIDATGQQSLAKLSTTLSGAENVKNIDSTGTSSDNVQFASAIVDFLDIEYVIDLRALMQQYGEKNKGSSSGNQYLSAFGADKATVLQQYQAKRPDIDPNEIKEYFEMGMQGTLI